MATPFVDWSGTDQNPNQIGEAALFGTGRGWFFIPSSRRWGYWNGSSVSQYSDNPPPGAALMGDPKGPNANVGYVWASSQLGLAPGWYRFDRTQYTGAGQQAIPGDRPFVAPVVESPSALGAPMAGPVEPGFAGLEVGGVTSMRFLKRILTMAPVVAELRAATVVGAAAEVAAASIGASAAALGTWGLELDEYAAVRKYVGSLNIVDILVGKGVTKQDALELQAMVAVGPAADTLNTACKAFLAANGSLTTVTQGPALATLVGAVRVFVGAVAGTLALLGASGSGGLSGLATVLLVSRSKGSGLGMAELLRMTQLGPAVTTFTTACTTAETALAASVLYTTNQGPLATWFAAFLAYLDAEASADNIADLLAQ